MDLFSVAPCRSQGYRRGHRHLFPAPGVAGVSDAAEELVRELATRAVPHVAGRARRRRGVRLSGPRAAAGALTREEPEADRNPGEPEELAAPRHHAAHQARLKFLRIVFAPDWQDRVELLTSIRPGVPRGARCRASAMARSSAQWPVVAPLPCCAAAAPALLFRSVPCHALPRSARTPHAVTGLCRVAALRVRAMDTQNQVGQRLRADLARLAAVLNSASSKGFTTRTQIANHVCDAFALHDARGPGASVRVAARLWLRLRPRAPLRCRRHGDDDLLRAGRENSSIAWRRPPMFQARSARCASFHWCVSRATSNA